ncbi:PREDICTED: SAC3 domain-containing protein 1 isoform X2 [Habropoda laboriosa]|uniref:SAC3 domain-containing protein 1 isoform X2 n=1 Tax=Habropoda laboriosa TaxID=597456 RepID=UPI00083D9F5E|nr:PREDICTED: SAC3 domain-containing protein 1 isoform X2 [Habropoda laboriosa]
MFQGRLDQCGTVRFVIQGFPGGHVYPQIASGPLKVGFPTCDRGDLEKNGLLHTFEINEEEEEEEGTKGSKFPKADPTKTVKCFNRPAAGLVTTDPNQLRPAPVLLSTVRYLFTKIATRTDVDWTVAYDFIFDRLRCVRQDVAIQRIDTLTSIRLFEPIVRFLVYSAQRLCERNISEFNGKINDQHLAECTTHLLVLYDESEKEEEELERAVEKLRLNNNNRQQMEALYILSNMGNTEALTRALQLPLDIRRSPDVQLSMKISLAWYLKNYARVCSSIPQLSPILVCAAMTNIQKLRRAALKIMSSGYNSKVLTFPGLKLQELLLYNEIERVRADCTLFGLAFVEENVSFQKANFKDQVELAHPQMYYTRHFLHDLLPRILLESNRI